jgi:hypothetical protein
MGASRKGMVIPATIVWLAFICAITLIMTVVWFSHAGITIGGNSARGVASVTASGPSDPPWTSGPSDPPWT